MANKNEQQQQQTDRDFGSTGQDNNGMNNRQNQQGNTDNAGSERGRADMGSDTDM